MRIAYLEDDAAQSALVECWLGEVGHTCSSYAAGSQLLKALSRDTFDLCLLDWELPDGTGIEALSWIRGRPDLKLPVIFITVRAAEEDVVQALSAGAADYLIKPLRRQELLARIDAVARRAGLGNVELALIEQQGLIIDPRTRTVTRGGQAVELTPKEFEVALFLLRHPGLIVSCGHLLEAVWRQSTNIDTRTVDTHVSRIRSKLGLNAAQGWRLSSVQNVGYRLERFADG
jgi:two-component system, OmpR family, response regulator RegX3